MDVILQHFTQIALPPLLLFGAFLAHREAVRPTHLSRTAVLKLPALVRHLENFILFCGALELEENVNLSLSTP